MDTLADIVFEEENFIEGMKKTVVPFLQQKRNSAFFISEQGDSIHYEEYIHPNEKAAIVISHGYCEFTRKYDEVLYIFYQAGYSLYILDHLGHGYSTREVERMDKVHVSSYDTYVSCIHTFVQTVVNKNNPNRKLVLFAHSMGGAIGSLYLESHPDVFSCSILSSPMLEINFGKNPKLFVWFAMQYAKLFHKQKDFSPGSKGFDSKPVFETSSCLSKARYDYIFKHRLNDEHYQTYDSSNGWIIASIAAIKKLQKQTQKINSPILLLQAEHDTMVGKKGQVDFTRKTKNTTLILIKNSKHEIFNALKASRLEYYNYIFAYLDKNLS